jgi:hypothetical protein
VRVEVVPQTAVNEARVVLQQYNPIWTFGNSVGSQLPRQGLDGPFVFANVPPGEYELLCYRPDHVGARQRIDVRPGKSQQEFSIPWPTGTASLRGRMDEAICGPGGRNPPRLWSSDRRLMAGIMPGADGNYQLVDLPAGDYYITDKDTRDAAPVIEFSLADGEDKTLNLTPDVYSPRPLGVGMLALRVFTSEGVPLPGCEITMSGPEGNLEPNSSQGGRVVFVGTPGEYKLTVGYPGFEAIERRATIYPAEPGGRPTGDSEVRIHLRRSASAGPP